MGDLVKPIGQWIASNIPLSVGIVLFIFCIFFEISKIKIYPLKWLWKAISWPFRKIDEQRTNSFKHIVVVLQTDIETKLNDMTTSFDSKINQMSTSFDSKLNEMATAQNASCAAVKECFIDLEKRFDSLEEKIKVLDDKQTDTELKLDLLAAARIKNHVLNFARQCRKGEPHSHEDFANLFRENQQYEDLVKKYSWKNDVYSRDYAYILRVYDECNNRGDFME